MFGLIERMFSSCDGQSAVLIVLFEPGYSSAGKEHYRSLRAWTVAERWSVDEGSPWLTCGRFLEPSTVGEVPDIAYTIDLSTEPLTAVLPKDLAAYVERLVIEPA